MLVKNEKLMEKYKQEPQTIFLVSQSPQRGIRVAENIDEKDWEWATGKSTVVRDSIEGFINEADAFKYRKYLDYLPYPFFVLEAVGKPEDLVAASYSEFGGHSAIQLGYSKVDVKTVVKPKGENEI